MASKTPWKNSTTITLPLTVTATVRAPESESWGRSWEVEVQTMAIVQIEEHTDPMPTVRLPSGDTVYGSSVGVDLMSEANQDFMRRLSQALSDQHRVGPLDGSRACRIEIALQVPSHSELAKASEVAKASRPMQRTKWPALGTPSEEPSDLFSDGDEDPLEPADTDVSVEDESDADASSEGQ